MYASEYIWEDWSNNNPKINGECTKEDFEESLEKIGEKTTINDFIFIGFAMHGGGGDLPHEQHEVLFRRDYNSLESYFLNDYYMPDYKVSYSYINNILTNTLHDFYARMCMVVQACESGAALYVLGGEKRIVMSCSKDDELCYTEHESYDHWAFLYKGRNWHGGEYDGFILSMGNKDDPKSILHAFNAGSEAAQNNYNYGGEGRSTPMLSSPPTASAKYTYL